MSRTSGQRPFQTARRPLVTENEVKNACLEFLLAFGFLAWRQNTGGVKYRSKSGKDRFVRFGFAGLSDILCILPSGRFLVVETKRADNDASDAQRDFMADVERMGGVAVLAYSVDDLHDRLKKDGYIK